MSSSALNGHIDQANFKLATVWYSSNAALSEGEAVCYNFDYGSDATVREPRRYNEVETPTTSNAQHFAGVSSAAYSAVSGGQFIDIYLPGSVCNILCGKDTDTVVGVSFLTFDVTAAFLGEFRYVGLPGAGSASILQTTTGDSSNPGLCLAYLQEGPQSGGVQVLTAANGARTDQMVGGTTSYIGASIGGNNTLTLADGTVPGLRKKFNVIDTELTTNDIVITITTGVTDDIDDVALASVTWPGAQTVINTLVSLYWDGAWIVQAKSKTYPTLA